MLPTIMVKTESGSTRPRSAAQVLAARANGARSLGPTTDIGKTISSANAIRSGVAAACVLVPGESLEERRAQMEAWGETFRPSTPGEAWLGAKIADCMVRLDRLDSLVRAAEAAGIEQPLKNSVAFKTLSSAGEALQAVHALAVTAESVVMAVDGSAVAQLAPAMKRVLALAEMTDVPMAELVALRDAMNGVVLDSVLGASAEAFQDLGRAARGVEHALASIVERARQDVEVEKARLALDPTLADENVLKRLDRYRSRITRELEGLLRLLQQVRALAPPAGDSSGSFVQVELRVVGRANLAQP